MIRARELALLATASLRNVLSSRRNRKALALPELYVSIWRPLCGSSTAVIWEAEDGIVAHFSLPFGSVLWI